MSLTRIFEFDKVEKTFFLEILVKEMLNTPDNNFSPKNFCLI